MHRLTSTFFHTRTSKSPHIFVCTNIFVTECIHFLLFFFGPHNIFRLYCERFILDNGKLPLSLFFLSLFILSHSSFCSNLLPLLIINIIITSIDIILIILINIIINNIIIIIIVIIIIINIIINITISVSIFRILIIIAIIKIILISSCACAVFWYL